MLIPRCWLLSIGFPQMDSQSWKVDLSGLHQPVSLDLWFLVKFAQWKALKRIGEGGELGVFLPCSHLPKAHVSSSCMSFRPGDGNAFPYC